MTALAPSTRRQATHDVRLLIEAREATRTGRGAELRKAARLSQGELARAIGVTPSCVCRWEAGERMPTFGAAVAYAQLLRELAKQAAR